MFQTTVCKFIKCFVNYRSMEVEEVNDAKEEAHSEQVEKNQIEKEESNKLSEEQTQVDEVKSPQAEQVEEEEPEEEKVPEVEPLWEGIIGMVDLNPFTANMHPVSENC